MLNILKKHISKDLVYTGINQLWKLISGPITLAFIPLYLTAQMQGYWFTFTSISALAVFADLGFTNIVLQFSAHEFANLKFDSQMNIVGEDIFINRLSSLFMFVLKWVITVVVFSFPVIMAIGLYFFQQKNEGNFWLIPWIIFIIGSGINFFNNTLLAFFEGCGQVAKVHRIRFHVSVINTSIIILLLYFKLNIYALAVASIISSSSIIVYLILLFNKPIILLYKNSKNDGYKWRNEFLKLFWKYAISFASGYFIFQIYTPVMFRFHGAEQAGKIGLSMAIWLAAFGISNVWIVANTPKINMLVSKKEWIKLDLLFIKSGTMSVITFLFGVIVYYCSFYFLSQEISILQRIFQRVMSSIPMAMLAVAWLLQVIINALAVYLRAHKEEPFMIMSIISAIYILIATLISAMYLPSDFIFTGFLSSYLWSIPWALLIFYKKRKKWHLEKE